MESETQQINESPVFRIDLDEIYQSSEHSFTKLIEERPSALPWSFFVSELSKSSSVLASQMKRLIELTPKLIDIEEIFVPTDVKKLDDLEDYQKEWLENTYNGLSTLGIPFDRVGLAESIDGDEAYRAICNNFGIELVSPLQIIKGLQEEYVDVLRANRIFMGTDTILESYAPDIPKAVKESIYYFRTQDDRNGGWSLRQNGGHILSLKDYIYGIALDVNIQEIKKTTLEETEFCSDVFVTAAHELGHAALAELYDEKIIKDSLAEEKKGGKQNLWRMLCEGYAMLNENLMIEILKKISSPENSQWLQSSSDRKAYLKRGMNEESPKIYLDGHRIVRKLVWQLGIYNESKEGQINNISNFLRRVDVVELAGIKLDDERYGRIIKDPIHNLPLRRQKESQIVD